MNPGTGTPGENLSVREILETLFFATDEPLTVPQVLDIFAILEEGESPKDISPEIIQAAVDALNREYEQSGRPFRIVKVAGGFQFATQPRFAPWLGKMLKEKSKRKLSVSALESLAVIAYKQPVTKPEIEAIRGVDVDYVLHSLLERGLITITGRAATPGRPLLYGTTKEFLKHFGLNDLAELPKPREVDELMAEAEFEVEKQMLKELEAKKAAEEGGFAVGENGSLQKLDEEQPSGEDPSDEPPA